MSVSQGVRVDASSLRTLCSAIQQAFGIPADDADAVSECLVEANLAGLDTHGVLRLKVYLERVRAGGNNPRPHMALLRESGNTALLEADNALGPVAAKRGMDLAIAKARENGVGVVVVRNANHYGAAGHYVRMAVANDMVGVSLTNVLASMPPTGGAERRVGNNPYAVGFPAGEEYPVIVDGATSLSSWGKVFLCDQTGTDLPAGCYLDAEGRPTVSPAEVLGGGSLLPFAAHKGYGIAAAITLLTGMLGDAAIDPEIPHPYKNTAAPGANSFFMAALRLDLFTDPDRFKKRTDTWIRTIRETRRCPGVDRIWLPGEIEAATRAERLANGILLHPNMLADLETLAKEAGVAFNLKTMK